MRVISQDGLMDIPYELCAFSVGNMGSSYFINVRAKSFDDRPFAVANYKSEEKAKKALETLNKAYKKCLLNTVIHQGCLVNLTRTQEDSLVKYLKEFGDTFIFRFPADDEIEV